MIKIKKYQLYHDHIVLLSGELKNLLSKTVIKIVYVTEKET